MISVRNGTLEHVGGREHGCVVSSRFHEYNAYHVHMIQYQIVNEKGASDGSSAVQIKVAP